MVERVKEGKGGVGVRGMGGLGVRGWQGKWRDKIGRVDAAAGNGMNIHNCISKKCSIMIRQSASEILPVRRYSF